MIDCGQCPVGLNCKLKNFRDVEDSERYFTTSDGMRVRVFKISVRGPECPYTLLETKKEQLKNMDALLSDAQFKAHTSERLLREAVELAENYKRKRDEYFDAATDIRMRELDLFVQLEEVKEELAKYRIALADAIRRPMGVMPYSAEGLVTAQDLQDAESRVDRQNFSRSIGRDRLAIP